MHAEPLAMNTSLRNLVLCTALALFCMPECRSMLRFAKPSLEDIARKKILESIASCFLVIIKRYPTKEEEAQFRAIREHVLTQIISDVDGCVTVVLNKALEHIFVTGKSIQSFAYNAEAVIEAHHRRGK